MSKFELRLAALSKLVGIKSDAITQRLSEEFGRITKTLQESSDYDELSESLKTLKVLIPRFHMTAMRVLEMFVRSVPTRSLTEGGSPIPTTNRRYRSAEHLLREAIEVADKMRYVHTEQVVDFLLEMSQVTDKEVRAQAERSLEAVAKFDLDVFYGDAPQGAEPQARMVAHLANLRDDVLRANANVILRVLGTALSPSIEGTSWSFDKVTIRRGSVISDGGVAAMRSNAIELAKRIYRLEESVDHRKRVLQTLDSATRREGSAHDADTFAMFERDAIAVLEFMRGLVVTEALPLVQSIEHQAYWDYYHGSSQAVKTKALEVRDALDAHAEYQIYKQLIGFEGIHGKWEDLSRSEEAWDYSDTKRREAARKYLNEINDESYGRWRDRILEFSKTRSIDMAMFPVYYEFLESIGKERPRLAIELLTVHAVVMEPFLIALMRGLWSSADPAEFKVIIQSWISAGQHLSSIVKSLYKVGAGWLDMLAAVVERAVALDDRESLMQAMGVAASLYAEGAADAKPIFMQLLRELAKRDDARWASVIWFSNDFRMMVKAMEPGERIEMLETLTSLPELDYRAEDILYEIGQHDPQGIIDFLIGRLKRARAIANQRGETNDSEEDQFEPVPYQFYKLGKLLSRFPEELLAALRSDFDKEDHYLFSYRGVRLITSAFPTFGESLESLLRNYVETGSEDDIEFVVGVLQAYEGSDSILEVCKVIVQKVPERSRIWKEVAAAIETTGVVTGEYGILHAFERKQELISGWSNDENDRVRAFSQWLTESLQRLIEHERQRANEGGALRKYRYGVGSDED